MMMMMLSFDGNIATVAYTWSMAAVVVAAAADDDDDAAYIWSIAFSPADAGENDDVDVDDVNGLNDYNDDGLADLTLQTPSNVTFGIQVRVVRHLSLGTLCGWIMDNYIQMSNVLLGARYVLRANVL